MAGERLDGLKTAMNNLAGQDSSLTGQFARFGSREKVTVITFSNQVGKVANFEITGPVGKANAIADLKSLVGTLKADGGTGRAGWESFKESDLRLDGMTACKSLFRA